MATKFQIKRTSITGRVANTTDPANTHYIATGELALNLIDGKMFSSNGSIMFEIGANLQSLNVASTIRVGNSTVNSILGQLSLTVGNSVVNTTAISVGANLISNTSALLIGNSTVNTVINSSSISVASIIANGAVATQDQILYANSTGGVYWRTPATITATEPVTVGSTSNGHVFYVY